MYYYCKSFTFLHTSLQKVKTHGLGNGIEALVLVCLFSRVVRANLADDFLRNGD